MKLTAKLVVAFMLVSIALTAINGYLTVQYQARIVKKNTEDHARRVGTKIIPGWREGGQTGVLRIIQQENREQKRLHIRWVWSDARPHDPFGPQVPAEQLQTFARGRALSVKVRDSNGNRIMHTYYPIKVDDGRRGGLELSRSLAPLDEYTRHTLYRTFAVMGVLVLASCLLIAVLGVRVVGGPLEKLIAKTRRAAAGDLSGELHLGGKDELNELAQSLNHMCAALADSQKNVQEQSIARIAALEQLRHADRLRTVGRLASGIAHELGTPLNVVSGRAGLIASGKLSEAEVTDSARTIKAQSDQMSSIIRQLLDFARRRTPQQASVDLRQVMGQTVELIQTLAHKRGVTLQINDPLEPVSALVDVGQMQQVFTNILMNAIQSMPEGGEVTIDLHHAVERPKNSPDADPQKHICIDVRDQGKGISDDDLQHLFEPFFTTKPVGEGTGMGLSIAYGIVQEHKGWIDVTSTSGQGSCFSVFLPKESE